MYSLLNDDPTDRVPALASSQSLSTQSGRVRFGIRGNAVWEWKTESGGYSSEINTQRLRKLQASELELEVEQTGKVKQLADIRLNDLKIVEDPKLGIDFNPYDTADLKKSPDPYQARVTTAIAPNAFERPPSERKPIKDLKAYGEWLAMKRRLAESQDD